MTNLGLTHIVAKAVLITSISLLPTHTHLDSVVPYEIELITEPTQAQKVSRYEFKDIDGDKIMDGYVRFDFSNGETTCHAFMSLTYNATDVNRGNFYRHTTTRPFREMKFVDQEVITDLYELKTNDLTVTQIQQP